MSTSGADSASSEVNCLDLSELKIPTPRGWSNKQPDLNIPEYFGPEGLMSAALEELGYKNVRPIIADKQDNYLVQAHIGTGETIFLWNAISGTVMTITEEWDLKEIVRMVGISPLNMNMTLATST